MIDTNILSIVNSNVMIMVSSLHFINIKTINVIKNAKRDNNDFKGIALPKYFDEESKSVAICLTI